MIDGNIAKLNDATLKLIISNSFFNKDFVSDVLDTTTKCNEEEELRILLIVNEICEEQTQFVNQIQQCIEKGHFTNPEIQKQESLETTIHVNHVCEKIIEASQLYKEHQKRTLKVENSKVEDKNIPYPVIDFDDDIPF